MSEIMSLHHVRHAAEALKTATEHDGAKGAIAGATGVAITAATALGVAGLALTPLGWGLAITAGAGAGGTGLFKKLRDSFN